MYTAEALLAAASKVVPPLLCRFSPGENLEPALLNGDPIWLLVAAAFYDVGAGLVVVPSRVAYNCIVIIIIQYTNYIYKQIIFNSKQTKYTQSRRSIDFD